MNFFDRYVRSTTTPSDIKAQGHNAKRIVLVLILILTHALHSYANSTGSAFRLSFVGTILVHQKEKRNFSAPKIEMTSFVATLEIISNKNVHTAH